MSELLNRGGVGTKTRKICAKTAKKPLKNASKMHQKRIKNDIKKFRSYGCGIFAFETGANTGNYFFCAEVGTA